MTDSCPISAADEDADEGCCSRARSDCRRAELAAVRGSDVHLRTDRCVCVVLEAHGAMIVLLSDSFNDAADCHGRCHSLLCIR